MATNSSLSISSGSGSQAQHNHGTIRHRSKMRCGINEGICVLNSNSDQIGFLFTTGLANCVEVIFRNDKATFICHLKEHDEVTFWIGWALAEFTKIYGTVNYCLVASGDRDGSAQAAMKALGSLNIDYKPKTGGFAIDVATGTVKNTNHLAWEVNQADVVGYLTAKSCIDNYFTGERTIGKPEPGDLYDNCPICKRIVF